MTRPHRAAAGLAVFLLATGCVSREPPPEPGMVAPARFAEGEGTAAAWPDAGWWRGFGSEELDRLIALGLADSSDLAAATARLRQADAEVRIAGAGLLPTVQASGGGTRSRVSRQGGLSSTGDSFDASLITAWELDLWGGRRAAVTAAQATALAGRFERDATALVLAATIADSYFRVLSLRDRLRIARANIANAERVLALVRAREAAGAASALDLARQRAQLATQAASLPALELQERQTMNALALLVGRPLDGFMLDARSLAAIRPVPVVAGLPSGLLERRPDLQAAEARLEAAAANVTAARAALYPSIDLTARAGLESDALRSILNQGNVVSVALSLLAPVFEGGRLRAGVDRSQARQLELLETYRGAVLAAFADVEDALAAVRRTGERASALATAAEEARRAFAIAEAQYRGGLIGLFELLDAQRTLFSAEDALALARLDRLASLVALYRALGGGWTGRPA